MLKLCLLIQYFQIMEKIGSNPLLAFLKTSLADWKRSCPFDQRREKKEEKAVMKLLPQHWIKPSGEGGADHLIKQHGGNERSKGLHFLQERRKNGRGRTRGL